MKNFEELIAWQEAVKLAKTVYTVSKDFPNDEKFGLTSQIRRASVSISSNLAEGFGRFGKKDKERFYTMALGSLLEVRSQLRLSVELGFTTDQDIEQALHQNVELHKLINALIGVHRGSRV